MVNSLITTETTTSKLEKNHGSPNPDAIYDPYQYGDDKGLTFWEATANFTKSVIATGILVLPFAFKTLGFLLGPLVFLTVAIMYYHVLHILLSCEYRACKRLKIPNLTLVSITEKIFTNYAPSKIKKLGFIFEIFVHLNFGFPKSCALFLLVMSSNIQCIFENVGVREVSPIYTTSIICLLLIAFCSNQRLLKFTAPFSALTCIFMIIVACIVIACSFIFTDSASVKIKPYGEAGWIPQIFCIFLLSIRSTGIPLLLKTEMIEPRKFSHPCGVLNVTAISVITICGVFGLTAYLNYGEEVKDNILLNLPPKSMISLAIYVLNTFGLFISYVLSFCLSFHTLWASRLEDMLGSYSYQNKNFIKNSVKIGIHALAYVMAVAIPQISLFAAISGSFGILIDIILAPTLEIILLISSSNKKTGKMRQMFVVLKDLLIIVVGFTLFCISMVQCVYKIINLYKT